jgi:hypothetical protein
VGYVPVAWNARIEALTGAKSASPAFASRLAGTHDALAIAHLEAALAVRRRAAGDTRFDRPRSVDATLVEAIAAHLNADTAAGSREAAALVAIDGAGGVRAAASFTVQMLEPPFVPVRRALLGRFALDPAHPAAPLVATLVSFACRLALSHGAQHVELTDLSAPGTPLHEAALATGARPWSRVVTRCVSAAP